MPKTWSLNQTTSQLLRLRNGGTASEINAENVPRDSLFSSFANLKQSNVETVNDQKVITYENGSTYTGQIKGGKRHGKGVFKDSQGNFYEGDFKDDKIDGFGVYRTAEGTEYTGDWRNEMQEGNGREVWPDGSKYTGEYLKGLNHGKGEYLWEDGAIFVGDWRNGVIEGQVGLPGLLQIQNRLQLPRGLVGQYEEWTWDHDLFRREGIRGQLR